MKFAIVLAAICFLGVAFAAPDAAPEKKLSQNVFADAAVAMQNAFKQALDNALKEMNKPVAAKPVEKRSLDWEVRGKRDLTGDIITAVMNMNNPIVLAQTMFKIMNELNAMGQNKTAGAPAPANNLVGDIMVLTTKTEDPMAFAGQLFKIVNTLAKDNKVVLPAGAAKPKFNFLQNPPLKNPNWNKKPATKAEAEAEVVEEVVDESTEAPVARVARQERLPEWEPTFKDQMRSNAYNIVGVGQFLEYRDKKKAAKAQAEKSKRELYKKTPTGWKKASELAAAADQVEDSTEATRVAREAEAAPAQKEYTIHDLGKMVDNFYAQFQAPKKSKREFYKQTATGWEVLDASAADQVEATRVARGGDKQFKWVLNGRNWVKAADQVEATRVAR